MRAISLWQPWASAWVLGIKKIETRHWGTDHRGALAVHAAKRLQRDEAEWWERLAENDLRFPAQPPLGSIVGVVEIVDCVPTDRLMGRAGGDVGRISDQESRWGNYGRGRFGWVAGAFRALPEPIPWRGHQSFFSIPDEILPTEFRPGLRL
jgi:hypothetical protein